MKKITFIFLFLLVFIINSKAQVNLLSGLELSYPFTGNANDASPNGYNGLVVGATLTTDRFGASNSAYHFNGSGYINSSNVMNNVWAGAGKKFTISVWVKPGITSMNNNMIFAKGGDGGCTEDQRQFYLRLYSGNRVMFSQCSTLAYGSFFHALGTIVLSNTSHWYHIVCEYDGTIMTSGIDRVKIWVDNVADVITAGLAGAGTLGDIQIGTDALGVGAYISSLSTSCVPSTNFNGDIDDIRAYNRLLNAAEITAIFTGPTNLGITENPTPVHFSLYPNPTSNKINISVESIADKASLKVCNLLGEVIYQSPITALQSSIDLTNQPKGIYFVKVKTNKGESTQKIVVAD